MFAHEGFDLGVGSTPSAAIWQAGASLTRTRGYHFIHGFRPRRIGTSPASTLVG